MATKTGHPHSTVRAALKERRPKRRPTARKTTRAPAGKPATHEKHYQHIFGTLTPRGRVFSPAGETLTAQAGAKLDLCLAQYAPRSVRMSWIYITHGLSRQPVRGGKTSQMELLLHWRQRDCQTALDVLSGVARTIQESGQAIGHGEIVSLNPRSGNVQHWLVCTPDKGIPERIDLPGGPVKLLLLMGITDGELQCALRVNPELADGRLVLLDVLKASNVFPMSEPVRQCLTRRRDFHKLWESAFNARRRDV